MASFRAPVLLTGSSGGLGLALARRFLEAGCREIAFQYHTRGEALRQLISGFDLPPEKHAFQADLTREEEVLGLRRALEERLGTVGILVNLAGASSNALSWKLSYADFRAIVDVNLGATFLCCREFIPGMRAARWGRIVNVSSVVAFTGVAGAAHYCAAKAGVVGLTRALARELAQRGINVNALVLGYFDRGMIDTVPPELQAAIGREIPLGRFGTPDEVWGMLQLLAGEGGSYVTGQALHVNGGLYS